VAVRTVEREVQERSVATRAKLLDRRREEFLEALAAMDPEADRLDAALDLVWSMFQGPTFIAWTELRVAARTDRELAALILAVEERFTAATQTMFSDLFPAAPEADGALYEIARDFAFALLDGVAVQRLFKSGERPASDYLDALKHVFRLARLES
jgi:hypothetical protein